MPISTCPSCSVEFTCTKREFKSHVKKCLIPVEEEEEEEEEEVVVVLKKKRPRVSSDDEDVPKVLQPEPAPVGIENLIPVLVALSERAPDTGKPLQIFTCTPKVQFIITRTLDCGWGCGYRNTQMLISGFRHLPCFKPLGGGQDGGGHVELPSIEQLQQLLQLAWDKGFDGVGKNYYLNGIEEQWIGPGEVYSILTSIGIRVKIHNFLSPITYPTPTSAEEPTHKEMLDFVWEYFSKGRKSKKIIVGTTFPPLYLQYPGHSITIIGIEKRKSGARRLLVFNPSKSPSMRLREVGERLAAGGVLFEREERLQQLLRDSISLKLTLRPEDNSKDYQILEVVPGKLLNARELEERKEVTSEVENWVRRKEVGIRN